jgi:hypothetical protein
VKDMYMGVLRMQNGCIRNVKSSSKHMKQRLTVGGVEVVGQSGVVPNGGDPKGGSACPPGGDPHGGGACPLGGDPHTSDG